jgi:hypothetical protein
VAGWAAMAALLCGSAGWWELEVLLMKLSQQATAGAYPELLPLMEVCQTLLHIPILLKPQPLPQALTKLYVW